MLKIRKLNSNATLPTRSHSTDAGTDLYASEELFLPVGANAIVSTSIAIRITPGYVGKIEARSSMAAKGLQTFGGVIDAGYSGEVKVVLANFCNRSSREPVTLAQGYRIKKGDKIAQLLIYAVETPHIVEVTESWESARGANGWGSSDDSKGKT